MGESYRNVIADEAADAPPAAQPAHRIVHNSALNLGSQVCLAICFAGVLFTLARTLGKEDFGRYYTVFAMTLAVQFLMEGGISTVLTSRIAQAPEFWRQQFAHAAGLMCLVMIASASVLVVIGLGWAVASQDANYVGYYAAAACACAAVQWRRFCAATFYAFELFREESLARVLQGVSFFAFVVGLATLRSVSIHSALTSLAISQVLAAAYLVVKLQRRWRCLAVRFDRTAAREWLAKAVPLSAGDVLREVTSQLGTLALGILQPASAVGIYSMAYGPLRPLTILPQAVLLAVFPAFSRMAVKDRQQLSMAFSKSIRLLWVMSIPMAVAIFVCAEPLVLLLGGREYRDAVIPMRILIWISTLYYVSIQFRFIFAALDKQKAYVRLTGFVFASELLAAMCVIPWWGYLGACVCALSGEVLLAVTGFWMCYRRGVRVIAWHAMLRATLCGLAFGVLLWPARTAPLPILLVLGATLTVVYFLLCLALDCLRRQEIETLYLAAKRAIWPQQEITCAAGSTAPPNGAVKEEHS